MNSSHLREPTQCVDQPHLLDRSARISSSRGLQTSTAKQRAREIATLSRLRLKRNSRLRGMSSPLEVAIEKKTTGASWPWNLSTVPIADAGWQAVLRGSAPGRCRA